MATNEPIRQRNNNNRTHNRPRIVKVLRRNRQHRRERQPNNDKDAVANRKNIDGNSKLAQVPRAVCRMPSFELPKEEEDDRNEIGDVERDSAERDDGEEGGGAADGNEAD